MSVPSGESVAKMARAIAAAEGVDALQARAIARSQRECVLCGHGLICRAWGEIVPVAERVVLEALGADGLRRSVPIHAGCLSEVSVGSRIAEALGFAEPEA